MIEFEKKLEAALKAHDQSDDASHDLYHARRVKLAALDIAARRGEGDEEVLVAAAYLHDLVNVPKNSPDRAKASKLSADAAEPILQELGVSTDKIERIKHAIEAHSFSAEIEPQTIEAKILQDADRLESLGAIGIARTFYIAKTMNSNLFHGGDLFASERELDDKAFGVDHFALKLLKLHKTMQTKEGREVARERTDYMIGFLKQLAAETGFTYPEHHDLWIEEEAPKVVS
ncbi:HD domain-containing protein [Pseudovibrio denitrificans]|uniref:HD domain-containing protein n=1 Tax=Pseudovibrio denitrificans TaxID=258256 RepID=UPI0039BF4755